jgi:hypothetical protein
LKKHTFFLLAATSSKMKWGHVVAFAYLLLSNAWAAPVYERPLNEDCLAAVDGALLPISSDLSVFPQQFQLTGDQVQNAPEYVEVSFKSRVMLNSRIADARSGGWPHL